MPSGGDNSAADSDNALAVFRHPTDTHLFKTTPLGQGDQIHQIPRGKIVHVGEGDGDGGGEANVHRLEGDQKIGLQMIRQLPRCRIHRHHRNRDRPRIHSVILCRRIGRDHHGHPQVLVSDHGFFFRIHHRHPLDIDSREHIVPKGAVVHIGNDPEAPLVVPIS